MKRRVSASASVRPYAGMPTFRETVIGVAVADRAVDLVEEDYDIVIRVDPAMDETLVGRSFLHDRLMVVAAPDLLRPAEIAVPVVVRGGDTATSWSVCRPDGPAMVSVDPVMRLSSMVMIRDAIRAGGGAARLPLWLVGRDIADGRLAH